MKPSEYAIVFFSTILHSFLPSLSFEAIVSMTEEQGIQTCYFWCPPPYFVVVPAKDPGEFYTSATFLNI